MERIFAWRIGRGTGTPLSAIVARVAQHCTANTAVALYRRDGQGARNEPRLAVPIVTGIGILLNTI